MLHKDIFDELMSEEEIERTVSGIADKVNADYEGKTLVVVGILKGSCVFFADLLRKIKVDDCQIDFIAASSYSSGSASSGNIRLLKDVNCNLRGKDVLVVEDILDSGNTLSFIREHLLEKGADSVKICTLFDKPSRRKKPITPDYCGRVVDDLFIVGYGLDYNERSAGLLRQSR